jgi:hypothetical protein
VLFVLVGREDALLASVLPQIAESGGAFLAICRTRNASR